MEALYSSLDYLYSFSDQLDEHPWFFASVASLLVGLSGILPLLIIPIDSTAAFNDGPGAATLKVLLSFAVGGLLGDVFLHILPEAWENDFANTEPGQPVSMKSGLWCLVGMLLFIVVEKLFATNEDDDDKDKEDLETDNETHMSNGTSHMKQLEIEELGKLIKDELKHRGKKGEGICGNGITAKELYDSCVFNNNTTGEGSCCSNGGAKGASGSEGDGSSGSEGGEGAEGGVGAKCRSGGRWMGRCLLREAREKALKATKEKPTKKDVAGYLNLMANSIDNFAHGLAVGGSFLVGFRDGVLTTFAILMHEIPHEVGDFAILLKSGFSRWEAAKAQFATASAGLIGALTSVIFSGASNSVEARASWIVPFTAGAFLHIALVTVLPDLLRERAALPSLRHLAALASGIGVMAAMKHYVG